MTIYLRYLIVFSLNLTASYTLASGATTLSPHLGTYMGTSPDWAREQSTCQVTVSINKNDELIVSMQDSLGTKLFRRSKENSSLFESVRLTIWSYPAIKLNQFFRNGQTTEDGFSHTIRTANSSDQSAWYLSGQDLDRDGLGSIQIVYQKNKRWESYNSILEYVSDFTGCYKLRKVQ